MTALEAARAILAWLTTQPIAFLFDVAQEVEPQRFQVAIRQIQPVNTRRVFAMEPLEYADCWCVIEIMAA